jgi:hypothetical protein
MGLLDAILDLIFPGKKYGSPGTTKNGIQVRSQAERRIADYFESLGLCYEYERELTTRFLFFKFKISRPDFYLPDYDVYVEYWGLLDATDDDDRKKYERSMKYKMARYRELGVKFISLFPRDLPNLDATFREKFKHATGKVLSSLIAKPRG